MFQQVIKVCKAEIGHQFSKIVGGVLWKITALTVEIDMATPGMHIQQGRLDFAEKGLVFINPSCNKNIVYKSHTPRISVMNC
jgi:hypothetical protein